VAGLTIHLIGQQRLCSYGFLDGYRAAEAKELTPSLHLIQTEKSYMPSPWGNASCQQDLS
jgi:hypothetical protein